MYEDLLEFLEREDCFIEIEGKGRALDNVLDNYNSEYTPHITKNSDGIIWLEDDANKWGVEYRLYVRVCPPDDVKALGFTRNTAYRDDFSYRLNNKEIIEFLFQQGYRIGFNRRG